jgi:hypothetical protein
MKGVKGMRKGFLLAGEETVKVPGKNEHPA